MAELEVVIDGQPAQRGAQVVVRSLDSIRQASDKAGTGFDKAAKKSKALSLAMSQLKAVALPLAAAFGVRELVKTVNEYQGLTNQLKVVTSSTAELASAQERLFAISQKTRTPLEATVGLFSKASIAAKELGASQEQLYKLVETTGKALAVGGTSAQEASGALRQLSQAFSSGIVRAEEFNSILEGAFPLAQAAARGLDAAGGSVGKLRNLVVKGKVTSKEFFDAILKGGAQLDVQFAKTDVTLGQSFTKLGNSFTRFIGKMSETSGVGARVTQVIGKITDFIDELGHVMFDTLKPTDELSSGVKVMSTALVILGQAWNLVTAPIKLAWENFKVLGETIGGVTAAIVQLANGEFQQSADTISAVFSDSANKIKENFANTYDELVAGATDAFEKLDKIYNKAARLPAPATQQAKDTGGGGGKPGKTQAELDAEAKAAAKLAKALDQQAESLKAAVDPLYVYEKELDKINTLLLSDRISEEQAAAAITKAGEAYNAANPELQKRIALMQEGKDLLESLRTPQEEYNATVIHYTDLLNKGAINAETFGRAVTKANDDLAESKKKLDPAAKAMEQFGIQAARNIQSTFADFLFNPFQGGLDGMVKGFADSLRKMAAEALSNMILQKLFSAAGGAAGGGFGSILTSIGGAFAARANGGPLQAGQAAMVGETGKPELFIPKQDGTVVPTSGMGGGQAPQVDVPVNITNVVDPASMVGAIESAQGTKAILNVIQTNPDAVKRALS